MALRVLLDPDVVAVEPGSAAPLAIRVEGVEAAETFEIVVEGVDPEWTAVPEPILAAEPGVPAVARVFFRPPRLPASGAGNYPFVVRLRSMETGEARSAQAILQVKPFHLLKLDVSPKKGYVSALRRESEFTATVANDGNADQTVQLSASDPEDACAYVFDEDQIEIGPGQEREIVLRAMPTKSRFVAGSRLIGLTAMARSLSHPQVVAQGQAQLEQRAFLSPYGLGGLVLLGVVGAAWWASRPQPPRISLLVNPDAVIRGDKVTLRWEAPPGSSVRVVSSDGTVVYEGETAAGERTYVVKERVKATFQATARRDGQTATSDEIAVTVNEPEEVPPPRIVSLKPDKTTVRLGESFLLRYDFSDAVVSATLGPTGEALDPALTSKEIKPTQAGETRYEVVARNKEGRETTQTFTVRVVDESEARILAFSAEPAKIPRDLGQTTLSWQVTRAVRVELKSGSGEIQTVEAQGSRVIVVTNKTQFVLIATDEQGRRVTRSLVVDLVDTPLGPPIEETGSTTGIEPSTAGPDPAGPPPPTVGPTTGTTAR